MKITPLKTKREIKGYIAENYPEETIPKLSREQISEWYSLVLAEEELPFESFEANDEPKTEQKASLDSNVDEADLDAQLDSLMKK